MTELVATELDVWEEVPTDEVDDEAPWGRKKDGTPKKRPGRQPGVDYSGGGGSRTPRKTVAQEELAEKLVEFFGPPLAFVSPLGLAVFEDRADKTSRALINLSKTRPRIKKLIDGMLAGSSVLDLVLLPVGIAVAMQVERERTHPDSMLASYFNIDELFPQLYPDGYIAQQNGNVQHHGLLGDM